MHLHCTHYNTQRYITYVTIYIRLKFVTFSKKASFLTQDKRYNVVDSLEHPYLDEGRMRYHSCMCTCCTSTPCGTRQYTTDSEPVASQPFDDTWESEVCQFVHIPPNWQSPFSRFSLEAVSNLIMFFFSLLIQSFVFLDFFFFCSSRLILMFDMKLVCLL